ncbi:MAG: class I SAM-dependent methyltransferase [Candidatus Tritonobacter lacicola]|nr:class I SAM-dependent methyltransferase [Candidatus Tritonobacter lacicola]
MDEKSDVESWLRNEGARLLRKIGLKTGDRVVDFGCGLGHYSIPAAQVVGKEGKVFAVDEDEEVLNRLRLYIEKQRIINIETIQTTVELKINLAPESVDIVLAFDVLHYMEKRNKLYAEFQRLLKKEGMLSVYPKHHKTDAPLRNLAQLSLKEIIKEIEKANFSLQNKFYERLIHDDNYDRGYILNFRPAIKNRK